MDFVYLLAIYICLFLGNNVLRYTHPEIMKMFMNVHKCFY